MSSSAARVGEKIEKESFNNYWFKITNLTCGQVLLILCDLIVCFSPGRILP